MADLHFFCALCGHDLTVPPENAGELAECTACGRVVPVPGYTSPGAALGGWLPVFPPEILAVEIKFRCPGCQAKLRVDARWEGRRLTCPRCSTEGRVPMWSRGRGPEADVLPTLSPEEIAFLSGQETDAAPGEPPRPNPLPS